MAKFRYNTATGELYALQENSFYLYIGTTNSYLTKKRLMEDYERCFEEDIDHEKLWHDTSKELD
jgi:hypothetical protein